MPFDFDSAVPEKSSGFDFSSAQAVSPPTPTEKTPSPDEFRTGGLLGQAVEGAVEPVMKMGSALVAKPVSEIAGMAGAASEFVSPTEAATGTEPEEFKRHVQEQLTYEPRSAAGKSKYNPLNFIPEAIGGVIDEFGNWIGKGVGKATKSPAAERAIAEAAKQATGFLGMKGAGKGAEAFEKGIPAKQAALDIEKGNQAIIDANRAEAQAAGFITPAEGGIKGTVSELSHGKAPQAIVNHNVENATKLVKQELGIPEGIAPSKQVLDNLKAQEYYKYNNIVTQAGPILASTPKFEGAIRKALKSIDDDIAYSPSKRSALKESRELLKEQLKPSHDPAKTLKRIQELREEANLRLKNPNLSPESRTTAYTQKAVANQLEGLFEENLGGTAVNEFRTARERLAKINDAEEFLDPNGNVDFGKVRERSDKVPLSGNYKKISDFAERFPTGAKKPISSVNYVDYLLLGMSRVIPPELAKRGYLQKKTPTYQVGTAQKNIPAALKAVGAAGYAEGVEDRVE